MKFGVYARRSLSEITVVDALHIFAAGVLGALAYYFEHGGADVTIRGVGISVGTVLVTVLAVFNHTPPPVLPPPPAPPPTFVPTPDPAATGAPTNSNPPKP